MKLDIYINGEFVGMMEAADRGTVSDILAKARAVYVASPFGQAVPEEWRRYIGIVPAGCWYKGQDAAGAVEFERLPPEHEAQNIKRAIEANAGIMGLSFPIVPDMAGMKELQHKNAELKKALAGILELFDDKELTAEHAELLK